VELQNIAVNNINVSQPSVFAIPNYGGGGVIFDCGTTLAYIVQPAYGDFVDAVGFLHACLSSLLGYVSILSFLQYYMDNWYR
jgi:hypothetical protein